MKSIRMEFVREGEDASVLTKGLDYFVVIPGTRPRQFEMPLGQQDLSDRLDELRYHPQVGEELRAAALRKLSEAVTEVLHPPAPPGDGDLLQLDVVTGARELWAVPFEAALAPDGEPLLARRESKVVLTRRIPQDFAEHQPGWPARPRILFAWASPEWAGGAKVEASQHEEALLRALQPWVEPLPGMPMVLGKKESVLTTLKNASLADIEKACRQADEDRKPYTHVHLLAHGIRMEDPIYQSRKRFGIALESDEKKPTEPEALARALRPAREPGAPGWDMPVVVTLAICDGGNATNSIIEAGGVAQELHAAGVPVVVASQLPLTFEGAKVMVGEFYGGWMAGKDVRAALHDARVALYDSRAAAAHDWVSLVAYVRLPEGYGDYLLDVRLTSQMAALETASKHASYLIDNDITDPAQYDQVADRLRERAAFLEALLAEHDAAAHRTRIEVVQENAGQLGSAYKRLAELLSWRAEAEPANRDHWLAESRAALEKARDVYRNGFRRNPSHHWTGVQYLATGAVLSGRLASPAEWYACYVAATAQRDDPKCPEPDRIWALGSIAELVLLAPLADGKVAADEDAVAVLADLRARTENAPGLFRPPNPIEATRRQLLRYVTWWTKANGFFAERDADLAVEAGRLAERLAPAPPPAPDAGPTG